MKLFFFIALLFVAVYFFNRAYRNTKDIVVNRININTSNKKEQNVKLNILHLSDLHLENISISPNELYRKLKDESIDLVALTGDFLDRKRTIPKLIPYLEAINKLNAKHGVFAVLGNHDYVLRKKNLKKLEETLAAYGCKILHNQNTTVYSQGKRINIIGIDDFSTGRSDMELSYRGIQAGFNLVLTHDPNVVLDMKDYHFDYLLAGHFHGGQICYPKAYHLVKMGRLVRMNMIKGLQEYDNKLFYISEGLGQTGVNIRVGSRPEITVHKWTLAESVHRSEVLSSIS